jgi:hypothetical protein
MDGRGVPGPLIHRAKTTSGKNLDIGENPKDYRTMEIHGPSAIYNSRAFEFVRIAARYCAN